MISTIAASDEVGSCNEADSENTAGNDDIRWDKTIPTL